MEKAKINLIHKIQFKTGYLPDDSYNAWTKYEVDETEGLYSLEVIFNMQVHGFSERRIVELLIHELIHCSFYQMHANEFLIDEEVINLNMLIDNGFPTLYFVDEKAPKVNT